MSRRPSLPGAAELFRATGGAAEAQPAAAPERLRRVVPSRDERDEPDDGERGASVTPLASAAPAAASVPVRSSAAESARASSVSSARRDALTDLTYPGRRETAAPDPDRETGRTSAGPDRQQPPTRVRQTRRQRMRATNDRLPSGREKHEEKITVYCSAEELFDLESARLVLRGEHGLVVDRGRIVREAVAVVLADLDARGEDSILVRRLREP